MKSKNDYRDILKARITVKISENPRLSQAAFARRIGVSRAFLALVLAKKKHLPAERLDRLCRALRLKSLDVVQITRSFLRQTTKGNYLSEALRDYDAFHTAAASRAKRTEFSIDEKKLAGEILTAVLFSLAPHLENIDPGSIAAALKDKFDAAVVAQTLEWLEEKKFLHKKTIEGRPRYVARESYIRTDSQPSGPAKYLPWLEKLAEAFQNPLKYGPLRVQSSLFSFDRDGYQKLNEECGRFIERIREISDASTDENVRAIYLMNCYVTLAGPLSEESPK